jgi:ElaB/YqjD/DUF883 family membrane-anchored ribosome-binding protein
MNIPGCIPDIQDENNHIREKTELNNHAEKIRQHNSEGSVIMDADAMDRAVVRGASGADSMRLQTAEALEDAARKLRNADISVNSGDFKNVLNDAENRLEAFKAEMGARYHDLEIGYHETVEPVETMISDHPIPAVLVAAGIGFLLGMLICKARD